MANQLPANKKPPSKKIFFGSIALFIISILLFGYVIKLNQRIDRTSGKVIETYTKRTFASRKQQTEREFLVVSYTVNGKEYTRKTMRREGFSQDYAPVYYYPSLPGLAWFYKKANANIFYCTIFMLLALLTVYMTGKDLKKAQNNFAAKPGQKNKQGK
ncbi:MAG: hypothetical protein WBM07_18925 [Chitinivibrionales bacterium]